MCRMNHQTRDAFCGQEGTAMLTENSIAWRYALRTARAQPTHERPLARHA